MKDTFKQEREWGEGEREKKKEKKECVWYMLLVILEQLGPKQANVGLVFLKVLQSNNWD